MENLTNLVTQYKQNKNKEILNQIYVELKATVQQKAKFIYFAKWYPLNLYHKCKYCRNCDKLNNIPKSEHNLICKECNICKCIKGFFNLKKDNLCEYEDVENDIWVEILRTINNFDITKDFNTYLFSCLWEFVPSFITKDFIKSLSHKSLTQQDGEGNETEIDIPDNKPEEKISLEDILKLCQTESEKAVIHLFLNDKKMTQEKAGKILGISQQAISLIFNKLQKKLKKYL
jgi:RNA polymerase sigma factor (sigma-70 family)